MFLNADEEDVPGAAIVRASVRDLALWRKVGVADRPNADLALKWLSELPSEQSVVSGRSSASASAARATPGRVWNETGHWLNLAARVGSGGQTFRTRLRCSRSYLGATFTSG